VIVDIRGLLIRMAAWLARYRASAIEAIDNYPTATSRSRDSYQSGTLSAPTTVVAYLDIASFFRPFRHFS
jgi:hypothetical protein